MMRLLALVALTGLAVPVHAQSRPDATARMGAEFTATDTNKDGQLSLPEVRARIGAMKAGTKSLPPAQAQRLSALWFARADADKNGRVSKAEADGLLTATFRAYDSNRDGKVTTAERAAARAAVTAEAKGR